MLCICIIFLEKLLTQIMASASMNLESVNKKCTVNRQTVYKMTKLLRRLKDGVH